VAVSGKGSLATKGADNIRTLPAAVDAYLYLRSRCHTANPVCILVMQTPLTMKGTSIIGTPGGPAKGVHTVDALCATLARWLSGRATDPLPTSVR
jgi:hypothetical protein